jgi:translation initiation factor IF-3
MQLAQQPHGGPLLPMKTNPRLSPLQSITYGSKDAPQLRSTGRTNNNIQNPPESVVKEVNREEIARQAAEKGFDFTPPKELSKRELKKTRKRMFLPPINRDIEHPIITFIDIDGKVHMDQSLSTILQGFSVEKYTLVLVDPTSKTARLLTNSDYKRHIDELREKHKTITAPSKEIQITWNVGDNDLMYRLNRVIPHLQRGARVNIILGARKVKLVRTRLQRDELLKKIREILEPYAVEWREMTGGFPNAELWFQGQSKGTSAAEETGMDEDDIQEEEEEEEEVEAEEQEEETDKDENENEDEDGEAKLNPDDPTIPWEQLQEIRAKFKGRKNRQAARESADKAFEQATGTSNESISEAYWKQLAIPIAQTSTRASSKKHSKQEEPPQQKVDHRARKAAAMKAAEQARLAELQGKVVSENQEEANVAQQKLRSVVTQFSKLGGTKSLFGSKLGRR